MKFLAEIKYITLMSTKEEAMMRVEQKAFAKAATSIRGKEFKKIQIETELFPIPKSLDFSGARCRITLEK